MFDLPETHRLAPIRRGQPVDSDFQVRGQLPGSFTNFSLVGMETPALFGIGLRLEVGRTWLDPQLQSFFRQLGAFTPSDDLTPDLHLALAQLSHALASDYRTTDLFRSNPKATHQIYGTVTASNVDPTVDFYAPDVRPDSPYSNAALHVDTLVEDSPIVGYFAMDRSPTVVESGEFRYPGILVGNWRYDVMARETTAGLPNRSTKAMSVGYLNRTDDARTLLHRELITEPGHRVFARAWAGLARQH